LAPGFGAQGPLAWTKKTKPTFILTSPTINLKYKTSQRFYSKLEDISHL